MIGLLGQVSMQIPIREQWISCSNGAEILPLRKWMNIVAVYKAEKYIRLYVNGEQVASLPITGLMSYFAKTKCIIGMVAVPGKPPDVIGTWKTVDVYYGLDYC